MQQKELHYFDSMAGSGLRYLEALKHWLTDEWTDKKNGTIDIQMEHMTDFGLTTSKYQKKTG